MSETMITTTQTLNTEILQTIAQIPEPLKREVVQDALPARNRRVGILKGTFVLPLSDDSDETLADFEEYL
jgi:hypothetical protein